MKLYTIDIAYKIQSTGIKMIAQKLHLKDFALHQHIVNWIIIFFEVATGLKVGSAEGQARCGS